MESKTILLGTTIVLLAALVAVTGIYFTSTPQVGSTPPLGLGDVNTPAAKTNQNVGLAGASATPLYAQSGNYTKASILSVSGTGVVSVKPDRAVIQMAILTEAPTAEKASAQNADSFNVLLKALLDEGIPRDNIETVQYTIYPNYDYNAKIPYILGYRAYHVISVTVVPTQVADLGKLTGKIIDVAVAAGVNQINSIQFTVSDDKIKDLRNDALKEAVLDARKKADVMVAALGVHILAVQQASESSYLPSPVYYRDAAPVAAGAKASTELVPGELNITASVSIVYEIG